MAGQYCWDGRSEQDIQDRTARIGQDYLSPSSLCSTLLLLKCENKIDIYWFWTMISLFSRSLLSCVLFLRAREREKSADAHLCVHRTICTVVWWWGGGAVKTKLVLPQCFVLRVSAGLYPPAHREVLGFCLTRAIPLPAPREQRKCTQFFFLYPPLPHLTICTIYRPFTPPPLPPPPSTSNHQQTLHICTYVPK